jgi:small subunit ribosomal protein S18
MSCRFCRTRTDPDWKDTVILRLYIDHRARIKIREKTHACTRHQRLLARAIKNAREMALLPSVRPAYRRPDQGKRSKE